MSHIEDGELPPLFHFADQPVGHYRAHPQLPAAGVETGSDGLECINTAPGDVPKQAAAWWEEGGQAAVAEPTSLLSDESARTAVETNWWLETVLDDVQRAVTTGQDEEVKRLLGHDAPQWLARNAGPSQYVDEGQRRWLRALLRNVPKLVLQMEEAGADELLVNELKLLPVLAQERTLTAWGIYRSFGMLPKQQEDEVAVYHNPPEYTNWQTSDMWSPLFNLLDSAQPGTAFHEYIHHWTRETVLADERMLKRALAERFLQYWVHTMAFERRVGGSSHLGTWGNRKSAYDYRMERAKGAWAMFAEVRERLGMPPSGQPQVA
ncbi:MAG TPA: hypothetical protein VLF40_04395 [Candidatus Saccharimonadales bacterium]|nr:hypothetical protein [Candidatus Saccharimonadales bacterium]